MTDIIIPNIKSGLSFLHKETLTAYPADKGWSLTLIARGPSAFDIQSSADGISHVFSESGDVTETWDAGKYWYSLRATKGADVVEVGEGNLEVMPNLATMTSYDGRSHVSKVLESIEAVLENRATKDQSRYRINNRELEFTPLADLMRLRTEYRAEYAREKRKSSGKFFGRRVVAII